MSTSTSMNKQLNKGNFSASIPRMQRVTAASLVKNRGIQIISYNAKKTHGLNGSLFKPFSSFSYPHQPSSPPMTCFGMPADFLLTTITNSPNGVVSCRI
jgi:hypothetical protein